MRLIVNTSKAQSCARRLATGALLVATLFGSTHAQSLGQILGGLKNSTKQSQQDAAQPLPSGLVAAAAPQQATPQLMWTTKAAFLQAASQGDLRGLDARDSLSKEMEPVTNSVLLILKQEYGIPPLPTTNHCQYDTNLLINRALGYATKLHVGTLTDRGPTFYSASADSETLIPAQIKSTLADLGMGGCATKFLGITKPHPIASAFTSLLNDYGATTKQWVDDERTRRMQDFATQQAQQAAAKEAVVADKAQRDAEAVRLRQQQIEQKQRAEADQRQQQANAQIALVQSAMARNGAKVKALGMQQDFLSSTLYVNYLGQWVKYVPCEQWLAVVMDNKNVTSIERISRNGHPGFTLKVTGRPSVSFLFRMEGKEAYVFAFEQSGQLSVLTNPSELSSVALALSVYAKGGVP